MGIRDLLNEKRSEILRIAAAHGAHNIRVFGSVARGEAEPESDIDFLVTLGPEVSLLDHASLKVDLEDLLGRHVDVIPDKTLREHLRERVLREAVAL